jgi:hypothetical protein
LAILQMFMFSSFAMGWAREFFARTLDEAMSARVCLLVLLLPAPAMLAAQIALWRPIIEKAGIQAE